MVHKMTKKSTSSPFRQLELQLQFKKLEDEWEELKLEYEKDKGNADTIDEILKLTAEKIKVLSEIYMEINEA